MTHPTPPQGPQEPDDLLPGEAELRALYGKLPQNEPGPALDTAVLRAAAAAVSESDAPSRKAPAHAPRWLIGLGSAATLVLAAGLAWHMRGMPATDSASGNLPAMTDDATRQASAPAPDAAPFQEKDASSSMAEASPPPPPSEPPKQPPARRSSGTAPSPAAMKTMRGRPVAPSASGNVADALDAPAAAPSLRESAPLRQAAAPRARAATDKALMPPPKIQAQVMLPTTPAPMAEMANGKLLSDGTPAQELQVIRQLYAQGHDDQARRKLLAFQRAYPEHTLPDDLARRLKQP